ncbi:WD40-like Beta Propeller Repeat [Colwellia chukchiensis]|uniref:WD40-like Beta Propeller Repeat n=1 Tax=Colwellia chukchiensis TaxID=641665 RepID=A0A1H7M1R4_9GAMM|nr:cytochrome D1 domain-containing protein [Colwellia chukchiensis]SEL05176.1 WD40-like Beta Propeller Repeat [Colwellia chukchiensis]
MKTKIKPAKRLCGALKSGLLMSLLLVPTSASLASNNDVVTLRNGATNTHAKQLYQQHCQSCHGVDRMGAMGPALFPENLSRLRKNKAIDVIQYGRPATQMPGFSEQLNSAQTQQLVDYIYTQPKEQPQWSLADIKASNIQHYQQSKLGNKPLFSADLMNLFIVVELGDHSATLLNGDTFTPITRFKTRYALHGGPKYSPDGRYVYFASRDGWISKYDIYNMKIVSEVRAGINTRNLAVSSDGKYAIVGNYLPHNIVILDTKDLSPIKTIATIDSEGVSSRVSAVYNAPPRHSFIVALKDVKEVWEIPYSAEGGVEVYKGWAHDYRKDSGEGKVEDWQVTESFPIRRIRTADFLDDFFFDPEYIHLIGASRDSHNGQVINLDAKKKVATIAMAGMPHLGSGITWDYQGKSVFASPNIKEGRVSVIDMHSWQVIKEIETLGPGFFMRSHSNSPYAWVDVFFGPNKDKVHVINKSTLEIVKTLTPVPGKTAAHVEFTKDGQYVLLSIWDNDGALIVYDANTLTEVKRLPMKKPSGKYNVYNKINYEKGTSH